ncbi:hypothetical protein [Mucilaginibacter ginsenosidivorax]|uniref:Uncharacterized protein n=1 Tax=Mucilaginibacter ginsenosidivorax TaxID=862126 RepID=A0A5B8VSA5_9SPHI|nr:hypothetical protein [Mucilaginibacter ginsenosidivorax]QEC74524.1 hypothetical protein FSB76_00620 [Mucilaginibacter ginsenosidivorax]
MIRTILTPENQDLSIHIPESYIGRKIEVLLYAVDELNIDETRKKKKSSDFRGKLNLTDEQYTDLQNHLKDVRNEWNNDI